VVHDGDPTRRKCTHCGWVSKALRDADAKAQDGIAAFIGKWPGEESDAELLAAVKETTDPIGDAPREHSEHVSAVQSFGLAMVNKLDANAHKEHWSCATSLYLLERLREEVLELATALDGGDNTSIRDEAADVANFAMMIADNCNPRIASNDMQAQLVSMTEQRDRWVARVKNLEARVDKAREALEGR
jgi:NTP pyrophosphatase (non-canonical NTP hydrolase)